MKQVIYNTNSSLIHVGGKIAGGLLELGEALNLQTTDHTEFNTQLTDYVSADDLHRQGREQMAALSSAAKITASNGRNFLRLTRDVMKPTLGYEYSAVWNALGFDQSLEVPRSPSKYVPMIQHVRNYLTANPTKEVAAMNITAAQATAIFNAYTTAQQAHAARKLTFRTSGKERNDQAKALRGKVRLLIAELTNLLPPIDPRWERFGLNQPGTERRPDRPGKVATTKVGTDGVAMKWDAVPRAKHYRIWVKVDSTDTEARDVGNSDTPNFLVEGLPAASKVELAVSAVNSGGESERSEVSIVNT